MTTSPDLLSHEFLLPTPAGRIYVKRWEHSGQASNQAPVILMHDSLGSVELWRDLPDRLARGTGRAVVAYDRLGFGRSDPHAGQLPVDFIAQEAHTTFAHVIAALQIDRFVLFGHSVGGGMSVCIAAAYAARCEALITESAQAFVEERTLAGIRAAQGAFAEPGQVERLGRYHGDKAAWVLSAWIDRWLDPAFQTWSLDSALPQVTAPNLVLHGRGDEYGSVHHPERIAALSYGPSSLVIGDWGHVPHREDAEHIVQRAAQWLADLASTQ
ncbi:alpha/beta fold hydrolase [Stenotrophomonas acidaminiphila]|jgi:pimeloyl-ACP methyl ester carboxylesterase|uniref:alpha/beta fold hydrolase n=1 Tax=Stenotrophomonas acidaminiphila TaxID=128780 RepID=UPI000BDDB69B|nr:alpha/beta fold hydrolase [Stenotrophomonas acidaminiphila]OZB67347.1 MAG: alpha/beta hydrolase [Xanthomonadales bacterium 14-68-21]